MAEADKIPATLKHELNLMTDEQLSYIIGRYTGPHNMLLSEKKFGIVLPREYVERILSDRYAVRELLGDN